jgi:hypothetical protein
MKRLNSKLDKSSDFEDYNDDLSNLNRPQTPPEKPPSPKQKVPAPVSKPKPPPIAQKLSSPRNRDVIQSKDKPVTVRTGPVADPVPEKQNLRLDTEQKNRLGTRFPNKNEHESDYSSDQEKENSAFITQPKVDPKPKKRESLNKDLDEEPKKLTKDDVRSQPDYEDED